MYAYVYVCLFDFSLTLQHKALKLSKYSLKNKSYQTLFHFKKKSEGGNVPHITAIAFSFVMLSSVYNSIMPLCRVHCYQSLIPLNKDLLLINLSYSRI